MSPIELSWTAKQYLAITESIGLWRRSSWRFFSRISCFSEEERLSFLTTSRHAFRFIKFSSGPQSLAFSCCFSVVWSPAASHWCWWSWRGTPQQGQSGSWDDVRFVVSLDLQIPSDFVSFNLGVGWLLLAGWDAKHTQGMTWQTTQGLSCCSTLQRCVGLGVFICRKSHRGLEIQDSGFFQGVNLT